MINANVEEQKTPVCSLVTYDRKIAAYLEASENVSYKYYTFLPHCLIYYDTYSCDSS